MVQLTRVPHSSYSCRTVWEQIGLSFTTGQPNWEVACPSCVTQQSQIILLDPPYCGHTQWSCSNSRSRRPTDNPTLNENFQNTPNAARNTNSKNTFRQVWRPASSAIKKITTPDFTMAHIYNITNDCLFITELARKKIPCGHWFLHLQDISLAQKGNLLWILRYEWDNHFSTHGWIILHPNMQLDHDFSYGFVMADIKNTIKEANLRVHCSLYVDYQNKPLAEWLQQIKSRTRQSPAWKIVGVHLCMSNSTRIQGSIGHTVIHDTRKTQCPGNCRQRQDHDRMAIARALYNAFTGRQIWCS
jgi:hypothetical protein